MFRVGDIATAAGLTVRAVHHYEDIGLLPTAARSAAGHRLYGPGTVQRLYVISRLRLSLEQIRHALDDQRWNVDGALRQHLAATDRQLAALASLRTAITTALADLANAADPTHDLIGVLTTMELADLADHPLRRRISILVYRDLPAAHAYLVDVFGFTPGEITTTPAGVTVHAEVHAGDGVIWLHPETDEFGLASPATLGRATATMAVMVDDFDGHHGAVAAKGGDIVYPPDRSALRLPRVQRSRLRGDALVVHEGARLRRPRRTDPPHRRVTVTARGRLRRRRRPGRPAAARRAPAPLRSRERRARPARTAPGATWSG